ncbi:MAG TPA: hypothetical protein VHE35_28195 [Kofleriaceae bacterium]|nr:hypothetical protein [Kofleriaceae bacterium]
MRRLAATILMVLACGCPHGAKPRPYPEPTVDELLARLQATREHATSFSAETLMDYWLNGQRIKGTVLAMGTTGSKVRINALSPAGNDVIADLACDGVDYAFLDKNKNCRLEGACSADTIASLFQVALAPDDFVELAVGGTPIISGAKGTVRWDGKQQHEVLDLTGDGGRTQTIVLDARDGRADVVSSEVKGADGKQEWRIDNADFESVDDANHVAFRVPKKSRLRTPGANADLLVEWKDRTLNLPLDDQKFVLQVDPGIPECPQGPPPATGAP